MTKRTPTQWLTLFSEQAASGLTTAAFCRDHELCSKYFGKRRKQLLTKPKPQTTSSFVPITMTAHNQPHMLELQHEGAVIKIPLSVTAIWLAELIHQLQA